MNRAGPTVWVRHIGRRKFNRVTVRRRAGLSSIEMYWRENKRSQYATLGHANKERAIGQAWAKAEELSAAKATHFPQTKVLAIRSDLVRVARELGLPEGYAPPRKRYMELGQFTDCAVRATFRGYTSVTFKHGRSTNPRDQWGEAIAKFGLRIADTLRRGTASHSLVSADVRRVSLLLGIPGRLPSYRQYRAAGGRWAPRTVCHYLDVKGWTDVGAVLGLAVDEWRTVHAAAARVHFRRWRAANGRVA